MSVPAFSLILFPLLCAGLFTCFAGHSTCAGRIRVPLTALAFLLLAGALPAAADPEPIKTQLDLYYAFDNGGDYILENDIDLDNTTVFPSGCDYLYVPDRSTVTIDLNRHKIDRKLTSPADNGSVIYVGGELELTGSGTITGGNTTGFGGGIYVENGGTFTMGDEVTISENSTLRSGGGVYVGLKSTFIMNGGTITGNSAAEHGGGVHLYQNSTFNISGSPVISGNFKTDSGNTGKRVDEDVYTQDLGFGINDYVAVTGELTKDASMGVSMSTPGIFTSGLNGRGDASNFFSNDPDLYVGILNGEAKLMGKSGTANQPDISPAGGTFTGAQEVTITTKTEGASIYYTTDKTDPTAESTLYTGTFTVSVSGTVKAIAVRNDLYDSDIASATYTITDPVYALSVTAPSFEPVTYGYAQPEAQPVTIENSGNTDAAVTVSIENATVTKDGEEAPAAFILNTTEGTTVAAGTADTGTYTVQPAADLGAGTYSADLTVAYSDTFTYASLSFTVNKDQQTLEVTQEGAAAGETLPDPQYQAPEGTVSLSYSGDGYGPSPDAPKSAGTYTVTVTVETENVIYTGSATFTITPSDEPGPDPEPQPEPRRRLFRMCEDCELPATGFSAVRPTALRSQPKELRYEPVRMRLMLPTLEEDIELVTLPREGNTWAADWLGERAGILEGSDIPGEGTAVIAAHNTLNDTAYGPFAMLAAMEKGDRIFVAGGDGNLMSFEVYANELLTPDGMDTIEAMAEENALVLVTCENESMDGGYLNRRAVFAK